MLASINKPITGSTKKQNYEMVKIDFNYFNINKLEPDEKATYNATNLLFLKIK